MGAEQKTIMATYNYCIIHLRVSGGLEDCQLQESATYHSIGIKVKWDQTLYLRKKRLALSCYMTWYLTE